MDNSPMQMRLLRNERDALLQVLEELKAAAGVAMLRDIRFDRETGFVTFNDETPGQTPQPGKLRVHPDEYARLEDLAGRSHVTAELSTSAGNFAGSVLILHECTGGTAWASGVMTGIRHPGYLLKELAAKSRLEDLGERISVLGHELRQPLFTIAMVNENLRLMLTMPGALEPRVRTSADKIEEQVQRAQAIITRTLNYARGIGSETGISDVVEAMRNAIEFLDALFSTAGIAVELRHAEPGALVGLGRITMEQVFVNVLRNAADSIQLRCQAGWNGRGLITVSFERDTDKVRCVVADNGVGLVGDMPESGFRPFFTTKADKGTGLGLYTCEQIVDAGDGTIRLLPGESEGAQVEIELPLRRKDQDSDIVAR